ncbi:MAG TPA: hypothetical protein VJ810_23660 [Blastocatellia bacterium]|nr:hypothetical protein [Blastocatellia bacterium]
MTAREFAAAINRPYPTVALWLRQNRVPGAYQEKVGDFSVWQIPVEAVEGFEPPKPGRPRTQFDIYHPIYMDVSKDLEWDSLSNDKQNARMLVAIEEANVDRNQPYTLMETREENLRMMRRIINWFEKYEGAEAPAEVEAKPKRGASNRSAAKKALKKMRKGGGAK